MANMILHVPHGSTAIPEKYRDTLLLSDDELTRELNAMTDAWTNTLFPMTKHEHKRIVFPYSRLVCDVERFRDDINEPMSEVGMGAVYTHTSQGKLLRSRLTWEAREAILTEVYDPHHAALKAEVDKILENQDYCLIVDCHSFPTPREPFVVVPQRERPQICIGTDDYHTPRGLLESLRDFFEYRGFSVGLNDPYDGCIVPTSIYRQDSRVKSVMIEVRRDLYMDEATGNRIANFSDISSILGMALSLIGNWSDSILQDIDRNKMPPYGISRKKYLAKYDWRKS